MLYQLSRLTSMGVLLCGLASLGCQGGSQASNDPNPAEPTAAAGAKMTEFQVTAAQAVAMADTARQAGIKLQAPRIPRPEEIQKAPKVIPAEDLNDPNAGQMDIVLSTASKAGGAK